MRAPRIDLRILSTIARQCTDTCFSEFPRANSSLGSVSIPETTALSTCSHSGRDTVCLRLLLSLLPTPHNDKLEQPAHRAQSNVSSARFTAEASFSSLRPIFYHPVPLTQLRPPARPPTKAMARRRARRYGGRPPALPCPRRRPQCRRGLRPTSLGN